MSWIRMTVIIKGQAYVIEQRERTSSLSITHVNDPHDWIVVDVPDRELPLERRALTVLGKGWQGANP